MLPRYVCMPSQLLFMAPSAQSLRSDIEMHDRRCHPAAIRTYRVPGCCETVSQYLNKKRGVVPKITGQGGTGFLNHEQINKQVPRFREPGAESTLNVEPLLPHPIRSTSPHRSRRQACTLAPAALMAVIRLLSRHTAKVWNICVFVYHDDLQSDRTTG